MRIILKNGKWVVVARWLGDERVIYTGKGDSYMGDYSLFDCIRFVRNENSGSVIES